MHNIFLSLALDLCKLHVQINAHGLCKFCTNAVGIAFEAQNVCTRCFGDGDFRGNFRFRVVVLSSDLPEQMQHALSMQAPRLPVKGAASTLHGLPCPFNWAQARACLHKGLEIHATLRKYMKTVDFHAFRAAAQTRGLRSDIKFATETQWAFLRQASACDASLSEFTCTAHRVMF